MTRQAADRILRLTQLSTLVGVVVIVVAAIVVPEHRGLILVIAAVFLLTSIAAYVPMRRSLEREVTRLERQSADRSSVQD